ncbi:MAG: hypothetical protein FWG47_08100, partial [Propionibacteriaceae bacterium]|nr:hypothetical protein [Propionibacteriaceae bacterium]
GLALGHYWFNGWISTIDTTDEQLFANGHTPTDSANFFVSLLKRDGRYTKSSTDPLVLDIEEGSTRVKTADDVTYKIKLRHWNPIEALEFLTAVREQLTKEGYQANLYVYMNAKTATQIEDYLYVWEDVAKIARLWVAAWGIDSGSVPDEMPSVGPWAWHDGWSIWQYTSRAQIAGSQLKIADANIAKADAWTVR